ncbi:hypothetical protein HWI79_2873 [Cryptosporidium felis]|nr:hypothetical protein HWI79_2873 [Cryptosporidium felis]
MFGTAVKLRTRHGELKTHRRSKTIPDINQFLRSGSGRSKNVVLTNTKAFRKSFTNLLVLTLLGIVIVDFIFRRFGALTILDKIANFSGKNQSLEGEFTFRNVNSIFQSFDMLKNKRLSLSQKKNGIGVITIKHTLKNMVISELDSEVTLFTRLEQGGDSLQKRIIKDIERGVIDDTVGLMVLLLKHKYSLLESPLFSILGVLPSVQWFESNGIFSMNRKDFDVASFGTSMEGVYEPIERHCKLATSYIYSPVIRRELGIPQSVDYLNGPPITQYDIQWAYMIVRSYSIQIGGGLAFIPSLVFIRKTNRKSNFSIVLGLDTSGNATRDSESESTYNGTMRYTIKLVSNKNILKGEEILFKDDKSLTDSEVFITRGQWLVNSHKMILPVTFPMEILNNNSENYFEFRQKPSMRMLYSNHTLQSDSLINNNIINNVLKRFDCSLNLQYHYYFEEGTATNSKFIFCLKLLSFIKHNSESPSPLVNIDPRKILKPLERKIEVEAASIGISIIQSKIDKLRSSTKDIISHFGHKSIHQLPIIKVREAEMIILRNIIKNLHNWYHIVSDIDTYESYYYHLLQY